MKLESPKKIIEDIVAFLSSSFKIAGFENGVIGVSGGVDSATSLLLVVQALGASHVFPILMPYGPLSTQSTIDAMGQIEKAGIPLSNITRIDIKQAVDAISQVCGVGLDQTRRGNVMARVRMTVLFDQAKKRRALVVGTENKSEHLLGYFTRFGDEASDIEPIRSLYKTQVYEVARILGVTDTILTKAPSAELFGGQTDENDFGFMYKEADEIMHFLYDEHKTEEELLKLGFSSDVIKKVKYRVTSNQFKCKLPFVNS